MRLFTHIKPAIVVNNACVDTYLTYKMLCKAKHSLQELNYVNYSIIAARVLRKALKPAFREEAEKREARHARCFYWDNGVMLPFGEKPKAVLDPPKS